MLWDTPLRLSSFQKSACYAMLLAKSSFLVAIAFSTQERSLEQGLEDNIHRVSHEEALGILQSIKGVGWPMERPCGPL